jgi:hypothetical protein
MLRKSIDVFCCKHVKNDIFVKLAEFLKNRLPLKAEDLPKNNKNIFYTTNGFTLARNEDMTNLSLVSNI